MEPLDQAEQAKKDARPGQELFYWLQTIIFPLVCIILLFTFVARATRVDGHSMDPSLADNELLLVWSLGYTPQAGDIVVASIPSCEILKGAIVKRIIATEGQTVVIDYDNNTVSVDGVLLDETYILEEMDQIYTAPSTTVQYTVPAGHVFLMGDNRNHSTDSRHPSVSYVDEDCLLGRAVVVLFPFGKVGLL